jgi:SAM-dependent methyltransferase
MGNSIKKNKKTFSREIGIEIAAICGRHFLKLEHLHYGYWTKDLKVDLANLHVAQENYSDFLISNIPDEVNSILDVGCGMGQIAKKMIDNGYKVDCVSPSPVFAQQTQALLREKSKVFECHYEQLQTENLYDLILFSESFQYIEPEKAIKKTLALLNRDGYLLICDVFRMDTMGKCPISGGHNLTNFFNIISEYPLRLVKNLDITEETSPNIDIENRIFKEVVEPVADLLGQLLDSRYPLIYKVLRWKYKRKIEKIHHKYFSGRRTAKTFKKFKSYRLLLYKKNQNKQ